jgi:hypothetical protein
MSQSTEMIRATRPLIDAHAEAAVRHADMLISDWRDSSDAEVAETWRAVQAALAGLRDLPELAG